MRWADIPWQPATSTLRWFAGYAGLFLTGTAALHGLYFQHEVAGLMFLGVAIAAVVIGILAPRALRPVFVGLMVLSFPMGWLMIRVILSVTFFCVFTPFAIWFRIVGRDALSRKLLPDADSYWEPKSAAEDMSSYLRQ